MRVLFVEPARFFAEESMNKVVKQTPHIGLAYVATATKEAGHDVKVLDVPARNSSLGDYATLLKDFSPHAVGFTAMTHNIQDAYEYAKFTKHFDSKILTVIGGSHANAVPEETLKACKFLDVAVKGEGEVAFPHLLTFYPQILKDGQRVFAPMAVPNLDSLPFPDWSLYDYEHDYAKAYSYKFKEMRHIYSVQTMRGCPYNCVFCFPHGLGKGVRFRSAENIFEEIKHDIDKYNASFFYLADSNSTLNRMQFTKLCNLIISEGLDIALKCETSVKHVDRTLLSLSSKAGFELIFYGIESGSECIQKRIGKNLSRVQVRKAVEDAHAVGLKVSAGFILGLPYETKKCARETIEFARSLQLDKAVFSLLDVYPNTELERMVEKGEGGLRLVEEGVGRTKVTVEVNDLDKTVLLGLFNEASHVSKVSSDGKRKFLTELLYYHKECPSALQRHIQTNLGMLETWLTS